MNKAYTEFQDEEDEPVQVVSNSPAKEESKTPSQSPNFE
jgi:hypothetical protein